MGLALAAATCARAAEGDATAFRSEIIPFESADLPTPALLAGAPASPSRTIAGELSLPISPAARLPAVILLHGDGGLVANQPPWVRALNRAGLAVFSVDSFSGRGAFAKTQTLAIEGTTNVGSRLVDAYRALDTLTRHPRIDADRIALMGFSSGGTAARFAAMQRFARVRALPGQRFTAFVALYPNCALSLRGDTELMAAPVRVHHGDADQITAMEFCREWAERARRAGADIEFRGHDRAGHGFDMADGMPPLTQPDVPNFSRCRARETDDGRLVNVDSGQPPAPGDACVGKGLRGGPDPQARAAAMAEVSAFLAAALKPRER